MRKIVLIIIAAFSIIACQNQATKDYALIKGEISNYPESKIYMGSKLVSVAENGTFSDTLKLERGNYKIQDSKNSINIYIEPGFDLTLNYDYNDFENTLVLKGRGADEYYYQTERLKKIAEIKKDKEIYQLSAEAYKSKIDDFRSDLDNKVNALKNSSSNFKAFELRNNTYFYIKKLSIFEKMHKHYTKTPDYTVSESFTKVIKDEKSVLDYANEYDFLNSKDYQAIAARYYIDKARAKARKDSSNWKFNYLKALSEIKSDVIKNKLAFQSAKNEIKFVKNTKEYYSLFMSLSTNERHKKSITHIYERQLVVAKGSPSPKFVNYESWDGSTVSLDDFKGKYVYIDVWATWCGPCKAEIPFLKEIEKKYHAKNIEFVSISLDKAATKEKWRKMVKDLNLTGVQLIADNAFRSKFVQDYLITGIPRFILLDPKGNIISSTAPRPSQSGLIKLFNEAGI